MKVAHRLLFILTCFKGLSFEHLQLLSFLPSLLHSSFTFVTFSPSQTQSHQHLPNQHAATSAAPFHLQLRVFCCRCLQFIDGRQRGTVGAGVSRWLTALSSHHQALVKHKHQHAQICDEGQGRRGGDLSVRGGGGWNALRGADEEIERGLLVCWWHLFRRGLRRLPKRLHGVWNEKAPIEHG